MARFDSAILRVQATAIEPSFEWSSDVTAVQQGRSFAMGFYYAVGTPPASSWESISWSFGGSGVSGSRAPTVDRTVPSTPQQFVTVSGQRVRAAPNQQQYGYIQGSVGASFAAGDYTCNYGIGVGA